MTHPSTCCCGIPCDFITQELADLYEIVLGDVTIALRTPLYSVCKGGVFGVDFEPCCNVAPYTECATYGSTCYTFINVDGDFFDAEIMTGTPLQACYSAPSTAGCCNPTAQQFPVTCSFIVQVVPTSLLCTSFMWENACMPPILLTIPTHTACTDPPTPFVQIGCAADCSEASSLLVGTYPGTADCACIRGLSASCFYADGSSISMDGVLMQARPDNEGACEMNDCYLEVRLAVSGQTLYATTPLTLASTDSTIVTYRCYLKPSYATPAAWLEGNFILTSISKNDLCAVGSGGSCTDVCYSGHDEGAWFPGSQGDCPNCQGGLEMGYGDSPFDACFQSCYAGDGHTPLNMTGAPDMFSWRNIPSQINFTLI